MQRWMITVSMSMLLMACSKDNPPEPAAEPESVFDPMTSTMDRAQDVEQQMNQRMDELNKRLEENEGR